MAPEEPLERPHRDAAPLGELGHARDRRLGPRDLHNPGRGGGVLVEPRRAGAEEGLDAGDAGGSVGRRVDVAIERRAFGAERERERHLAIP